MNRQIQIKRKIRIKRLMLLPPGGGAFRRDTVTNQCLQGFWRFWRRDEGCGFHGWNVSLGQCLQGLSRCHDSGFSGLFWAGFLPLLVLSALELQLSTACRDGLPGRSRTKAEIR